MNVYLYLNMVETILTKKEAIEFLSINEKEFSNYFKSGQEFSGFKERGRWKFNKSELEAWKSLRDSRIIKLNLVEV